MLAGWVIGLGLLCVWYSEHVKLNAKIVELNGALIALAEREREREREGEREIARNTHAQLTPACCANTGRRRAARAAV